MDLTSEEWLDIRDWLSELYVHYQEQALIYRGYKRSEIYTEEASKINAFLEQKGQ